MIPQSEDDSCQCGLPRDETVFCEFSRGEKGSHTGAELICGNGIMNGNPRDDIGREGNQPASAGYGVDEACKKYEGADDDISKQIHKNLP